MNDIVERTAAWRTIDANFNRAVEGLRVVEDHARFVLNDAFLASQCKSLRHDLTSAVGALDQYAERIIARDTLADVGTNITTPQESERSSLEGLVAANWQRVSQALRVIEEFAKFFGGAHGARWEQLRYQSYTLAKACAASERSRSVWQNRRLYVLVGGCESAAAFAVLVKQLIAAKVDVLQLRDKELNDRELLARAQQLRSLLDEGPLEERPLFIVNDRPDIAVLARADGVHVGQDELPVSEVRRLVGTSMQIGLSTHSIEQARAAVLAGADYLGCGPTFPSATKSFDEFPGLAFLQQVAEETSLPAFAIGGINTENLPQVLATGLSRVAVGHAITQAADPGAAAAQFQRQLRSPA